MVGIESGYLIFSLLVFLGFFLGVLWWVIRADKNYIRDMKNKPFEN